MKAKDIISKYLGEDEPMPGRRRPRPSMPFEDPDFNTQEEKGQFTREERFKLIAIIGLMLAHNTGNMQDENIIRNLIDGKDIEKSDLMHIVDETMAVSLPPGFQELRSKIEALASGV